MIFVVGNSRSGTTMVSRILGRNANVHTFQELHYFDELSAPFHPDRVLSPLKAKDIFCKLLSIDIDGYYGKRHTEQYSGVADEALQNKINITAIELYKLFLNFRSGQLGKKVACAQTPQNIFYLETLKQYIPESKFIVMVRDPRDVLLSQKNKWKRRKYSKEDYPLFQSIRARVNYHPITICKLWVSAMKQISIVKNDSNLLIIKFEDLIADPELVVNKICKHVSLEFSLEMLNIPQKGSSHALDKGNDYGIDSKRTGGWHQGGLTHGEISLCQNITGNFMKQYGYVQADKNGGTFQRGWYYFTLPFSMTLALLFNLKRAKDIPRLFKKFFN